jgi:hypothetical protein
MGVIMKKNRASELILESYKKVVSIAQDPDLSSEDSMMETIRLFGESLNTVYPHEAIKDFIDENLGPSMLSAIVSATNTRELMDKANFLELRGDSINTLWSSVAGQVGFMAFYIGYITKDLEDEQSRKIVSSLEKFLEQKGNGHES